MSDLQNDKNIFEDWAEGQLDHTISRPPIIFCKNGTLS